VLVCEHCRNLLRADDSKELARVGPGQCFGELALMSGDLRAANVMALDNSVVRASCSLLLSSWHDWESCCMHSTHFQPHPAVAIVETLHLRSHCTIVTQSICMLIHHVFNCTLANSFTRQHQTPDANIPNNASPITQSCHILVCNVVIVITM
jgi:hypothetical protein